MAMSSALLREVSEVGEGGYSSVRLSLRYRPMEPVVANFHGVPSGERPNLSRAGRLLSQFDPRWLPEYYAPVLAVGGLYKQLGQVALPFEALPIGGIMDAVGLWSQTIGTGRNLVVPAGWTATNTGCSPLQRWWGINQIVACGTPQARALSTENKVLPVAGPAWVFCTSPAGAVNQIFNLTFNTNGRFSLGHAPSPAELPYRLGSLVLEDPFADPFADAYARALRLDARMWSPRVPRASLALYEVPAVTVVVDPVRGPSPAVGSQPHKRVPPRSRRREGKGGPEQGNRFGVAKLGDLWGSATEADDFLDAVIGAIPDHPLNKDGSVNWNHRIIRPNSSSGWVAKWEFALNHFQYMSTSKFLENFVRNEVGDFVVGKANSVASRGVVSTGYWPFMRGPSVSRYASYSSYYRNRQPNHTISDKRNRYGQLRMR